jgi:hypothetical protein
MTKVLVLCFSSFGHMEQMANAAADGARQAGAQATRYGSCVPVTTIGIAQFSDWRPVGDKSADSSAKAAGNVTGVTLSADVGDISQMTWFPSIQDAPLALRWQDR